MMAETYGKLAEAFDLLLAAAAGDLSNSEHEMLRLARRQVVGVMTSIEGRLILIPNAEEVAL